MSVAVAVRPSAIPAQALLRAFSGTAGERRAPRIADIAHIWLASSKRAINQLAKVNTQRRDDISPPSAATINNAQGLLEDLLYPSVVGEGLPWVPPHVSLSEEGEISFEWWHASHKLTVYVGSGLPVFIRVWGPNVHEEMEDGEINNNFPALWTWLMGR